MPTPMPNSILTTTEEVEPFITYYIAPRYTQASHSLAMMQYVSGMVHMLDMMCVSGSAAEALVREVKDSTATVISKLIQSQSGLYAVVIKEHNSIKAGIDPYERIPE